MAGVEPSENVKIATILGPPIGLPSANDITSAGPISLFKKLGLQGVSDANKKIIIQSFYDKPPTDGKMLSLQDYPEVQTIVKGLLIDLIHKQNPKLSILKDAAMKDDSITITYKRKNNYSIGLSILIPGHLLAHDTSNSANVQVSGITQNGIENGKIMKSKGVSTNMALQAEGSEPEPVEESESVEEPVPEQVQNDVDNAFTISIVGDENAINGTVHNGLSNVRMEDYVRKPVVDAVSDLLPHIEPEQVQNDADSTFTISIVDDEVSLSGSMNGVINEDYLERLAAENDTDANIAIASAVSVMEDDFINGTIKGLSRIHAQKHIKNSEDATKVDEILRQIVEIGDTKAKHHMCSLFAPPSSSSSSSFASNKRIASLFDTFLSIHTIDVISKRTISNMTNKVKVKVQDKNSVKDLNSDNKLDAYHSLETTFYNDMCGAIPPLSTLFTNFDAIPINEDDINTLKTQLPYKVSILNENNSKTLSDMVNILQILYALSHITQLIEYMLYNSSSFPPNTGGPILSRINYDPPTRAIPESSKSKSRPVTYASTIGQTMKGLSVSARKEIMQLIKNKTGATELTVGLAASDKLIDALSDDDKGEIKSLIDKLRKKEKIGISTTSSKTINIKQMMLDILNDDELLKEIEFVHNNPKYVGKIDVNMQNLKEKIMRMIIAATPGLVDETEKINVSVTNYDAQINDILKDVNSKIKLLKDNDAHMIRLLQTIHLIFGKERPTKTIYSGVLFDAIHRMDAKDMADILTIISEIDTIAIEITKTRYDENDKLVVLFFTLIKLQKRLLDIQSSYLLQYITTLFIHSSQTCSMMICSYLLDQVSTVDELKYALKIFPMPATKTMPDMMVIIDDYNESIQHMIHDQFILYKSMLDILDFGTPSKGNMSDFVTDISTQLTIAKKSSDTLAKEIGLPLAKELDLPLEDGETLISEVYRNNIERVSSINLPIKQELLSKLTEIKLQYLMEKRNSTSYLESFRKTLYKNIKGVDEPVLHAPRPGWTTGWMNGKRIVSPVSAASISAPVSVAPVSAASISAAPVSVAPVSAASISAAPVSAPVNISSINIEVKNSEEDADIAVAAVVAVMENEVAAEDAANGVVYNDLSKSRNNDYFTKNGINPKKSAIFLKFKNLESNILTIEPYIAHLVSTEGTRQQIKMLQDLRTLIKILQKNEVTPQDASILTSQHYWYIQYIIINPNIKAARKYEAAELAKERKEEEERRRMKKNLAEKEESNFTQSMLNAASAAQAEENARIAKYMEERERYIASLRANKELLERRIASLKNGTDMQKGLQSLLQVIINKLTKIENGEPLVQSNRNELSALKGQLEQSRNTLSRRNLVKTKYKTIGKAIDKLRNNKNSGMKSELIKMREILDRNEMTFENQNYLLHVSEPTMNYIRGLSTNEAEEKEEIKKYVDSIHANLPIVEDYITSLEDGEVKDAIQSRLEESKGDLLKLNKDELRELHFQLALYRTALHSLNMLRDRYTSIQYYRDADNQPILNKLIEISKKDEIELTDLNYLSIYAKYISKLPKNDDISAQRAIVRKGAQEAALEAARAKQRPLGTEAAKAAAAIVTKRQEDKAVAEAKAEEAARQIARQEEASRAKANNEKRIQSLRNISEKRTRNEEARQAEEERQEEVRRAAANEERIKSLRNISKKRSNNQNERNRPKNNTSLRNNSLKAAMIASQKRNTQLAKQRVINNQAAEARQAIEANRLRVESLKKSSEERARDQQQIDNQANAKRKQANAKRKQAEINRKKQEEAAKLVEEELQREAARAAARRQNEKRAANRMKREEERKQQELRNIAAKKYRSERKTSATSIVNPAVNNTLKKSNAAKNQLRLTQSNRNRSRLAQEQQQRLEAITQRERNRKTLEDANRERRRQQTAKEANERKKRIQAEQNRLKLVLNAEKVRAATKIRRNAEAEKIRRNAEAEKIRRKAEAAAQVAATQAAAKERQRRLGEEAVAEISRRAEEKQKLLNKKTAEKALEAARRAASEASEEAQRASEAAERQRIAEAAERQRISEAAERQRIANEEAKRIAQNEYNKAEANEKRKSREAMERHRLEGLEEIQQAENSIQKMKKAFGSNPSAEKTKSLMEMKQELNKMKRRHTEFFPKNIFQQGGKRRTKNHTQRNRRTKNLTRRKRS